MKKKYQLTKLSEFVFKTPLVYKLLMIIYEEIFAKSKTEGDGGLKLNTLDVERIYFKFTLV